MSAIAAIFNRSGEPVDLSTIELMGDANAEMAVDGHDVWLEGSIGLAHQHFWMTRQEWGERQPLYDADSRCTITADVRLDNRGELIKRLELNKADGQRLSDASLILYAYRRWGSGCVEYLRGDFAFIVWDSRLGRLFAARDVLGARGLSYFLDRDLCLMGTAVVHLLAHPAIKTQINEGKIADFLAGPRQEPEETYYQNIYYCPPAHCITVTVDSIHKWRYWDIDPGAKIRYKDERDYAAHFLGLLTDVVRARLRTVGPVGISMSGGLDSTMLAAIASDLLPETDLVQAHMKSFSYVFDELTSCDERDYFLPVIERYQLESTLIPCDDRWTLRDRDDWPIAKGYVLNDPYAWLPVAAMKAAQKEGCRVLMAGYYGDVLFAGGIAWAAGMMSDRRLIELSRTVRQNRGNVYLGQDLVVNGLRYMIPPSLLSFAARNLFRNDPVYTRVLDPHLVKIVQSKNQDADDQIRRREFGADRWQRYQNLTSNSFAQGASATRFQYNRHRLELEMPYWDRSLVEFVMAVPADQLGRPEGDRWLMRNAAADLLPAEIRDRKRRTVFLPLMGRGVVEKEKATVDSLLSEPQVVKRRYIRSEWLEDQLDSAHRWTDEENAYFLWKCLSLEMWLRRIQ